MNDKISNSVIEPQPVVHSRIFEIATNFQNILKYNMYENSRISQNYSVYEYGRTIQNYKCMYKIEESRTIMILIYHENSRKS